VLGNLFAGLVLLFARPYIAGEHVRVLSGAINGPHEGVVISAGLLYTTLQTDNGPLNIPNSTLMAAAVGAAPIRDPKSAGSKDPAVDSAPTHAPTYAPGGSTAVSPTGDDAGQQAHDLATAIAEGQAITDAAGSAGAGGAQKQADAGEGRH
jgi:Mechanosensitive ion channel